ncbi:hypothetical protein AYO45_03300 [Gammaproteobacteria bacterium SCGC AG-212-F23]|nr:hypothetical protein AYO45_03300 [Gammaproteobacteria bacterium SCGC AG-212-F23]
MQTSSEKKILGFGLGLRSQHYETILEKKPKIDWFEILTENYLVPGGKPLHYLDRIREHYPLVMHGVSLSIGSTDKLDTTYLQEVKNLAKRIEPAWVSDHLCWTGVNGKNLHDLLPLPYTEETINHVANRIQQVQEFLGQQLLIENVSSYLTYQHSEMTEWEFFAAIAKKADCLLLLDVNNVYVSSVNHHFDPLDYIHHLPVERIYQIHLAGHSRQGHYIIDTHDAPVPAEVWDLYANTLKHTGFVSTMIERDDNIPELDELLTELGQAKAICKKILAEEFSLA